MKNKFTTKIEILFLVVLSILMGGMLFSCHKENPILDKAETLMESHPDSSLYLLKGMDKSELSSKSEEARYALLMSMALDKNYVDTTTFDVLQPALDYYIEEGTPDEKLRTYYYQGRIFQNQGDYDKALSSFTKGIDLSSECSDSLTLARTLVAQASCYYEFYDFESYTNSNLKAGDICNVLRHPSYEFFCLLNALNGTVILEKKSMADSLLIRLGTLHAINNNQNNLFLERYLSYTLKFGSKDDLEKLMIYKNRFLQSGTNCILDLASAYSKLGDYNTSISLLEFVNNQNVSYDTLKYQSIYVANYKNMGDYGKALSIYEDFSHRIDVLNALKFNQKTKYIKEKNQLRLELQHNEIRKARVIWGFGGGIVILSMGIVILILIVRNKHKQKALANQKVRTIELENDRLKIEKENLSLENINLQLEKENKTLETENLQHQIEKLQEERESLKRIIEMKEDLSIDIQKAIQVRIEMLNSLFAGYITDKPQFEKPYQTWVKELTENTEEFMNTNRLAFQASHPRFIKYFQDHKLTEEELNYVCLYALGLNGKEVGKYIKKSGHVNMSSVIRKKLGIDHHETNIRIYVGKLLKSL